MAKLILLNSDDAGKAFALEPGRETLLGRTDECDIALDNVPGVSREHASFKFQDGAWIVEDLDSSNGIYVDNEQVSRRVLRSGDVMWFSQISIRFEDEPGDGGGASSDDVAVSVPATDATVVEAVDARERAASGDIDGEQVREVMKAMADVEHEMSKVIIGQKDVCRQLITALLCSGHCLMLGLPGLGKTLMVQSLAAILALRFKRIQFTPDLMPSDIVGSDVLEMDEESGRKQFRFIHGPIFTNMLLADEINRTPPKTQAALLEAMQERQVTASNQRFPLPQPFFVLATQNPLEQEGTYPLPEAQMDRFMFNIIVDYPDEVEEEAIVQETTSVREVNLRKVLEGEKLLELQHAVRSIPVSPYVVKYATRLTRATRPGDAASPEFIREHVAYGAGPRAAQFLVLGAKARAMLNGRLNVNCEDVRSITAPVLRHRILTNFTADSEGIMPDDLIAKLIVTVSEPRADEY